VPKCQLDIELCGGTFVNESCVRDGNMVSGRTWHDQHKYMREFMTMLREQAQSSNGSGFNTIKK
jgi:protease I